MARRTPRACQARLKRFNACRKVPPNMHDPDLLEGWRTAVVKTRSRAHRHRRSAAFLDEDLMALRSDAAPHRILAVRKLKSGRQYPDPLLCLPSRRPARPRWARSCARRSAANLLGSPWRHPDESGDPRHRRTYIGALPGNVIQAIPRPAPRNPVMMLGRIVQAGLGCPCDPSAALLMFSTPSKCHLPTTTSPFPRSLESPFIVTANVMDNIQPPCRDRMEIIEMPGYIEDESWQSPRRYLVKRQLARRV